ncbi:MULTISPECIES: helix-turn-helix domain-containing protein [Pseudomonas]|jgi:transcriptional regulator with XRE-family HTH domain|nr:hypothetical protein BFW89_08860 [Pseudomonas synxantha]VCU67635.1 mupirocin cluster-associated transcription factor RumP [Pseudomonas synxantha]
MYRCSKFVNEVIFFRTKKGMTQADFWAKFGVTQSSGSRIEKTGRMLVPLYMLLRLYCAGVIADDDLELEFERMGKSASDRFG